MLLLAGYCLQIQISPPPRAVLLRPAVAESIARVSAAGWVVGLLLYDTCGVSICTVWLQGWIVALSEGNMRGHTGHR